MSTVTGQIIIHFGPVSPSVDCFHQGKCHQLAITNISYNPLHHNSLMDMIKLELLFHGGVTT